MADTHTQSEYCYYVDYFICLQHQRHIMLTTVIGDPLMTVPLFLPNTSVIAALGENDILSLCYDVHGESDATSTSSVMDVCP